VLRRDCYSLLQDYLEAGSIFQVFALVSCMASYFIVRKK
jgi:hypothetical protein